MKRRNKNMLIIGTLGSILIPMPALIACASQEQLKLEKSQGIHVTYWPNIDPAISLGAKVESTSLTGSKPKHSATWFKGTKFDNKIKEIKENKPLWDADTMDEEYWRNLDGEGKATGIAHESWIKTPQKEFLETDPKIVPIEFDYNMGIPNEKYHWKINGATKNNPKEVLIQNKGERNYLTPGNLYQIRDMGEVLKKAAKSLDDVYETNKYSKKASEIINITNKHWAYFAKLQNNSPIDIGKKEWASDSKKESLLIINIKTGAVSAGSNNTVAFATPSSQKEAYTKTHFSMPELSQKQFEILKLGDNLNDNGEAVVASRANNGVYFPNYKGNPLPISFWNYWNGKIDKIVIGVSPKELPSTTIRSITNKQEYNFLSKMMKGGSLTDKNTVIVDTYLAGSGSYGFRMPIGQNVFIDKITKAFYPNASIKTKWDF